MVIFNSYVNLPEGKPPFLTVKSPLFEPVSPRFPAALLWHLRRDGDPRSLRGQLRKSRGPDHEAHEAGKGPEML